MAFFVSYKNNSLIDIFDENITKLYRINVAEILSLYDNIEYKRLRHIKIPKIDWSCRQHHHVSSATFNNQLSTPIERLLISGDCVL